MTTPASDARPSAVGIPPVRPRHHFLWLLVALVLLLLMAPVLQLTGHKAHPMVSRGIVSAMFVAMMLTAVYVLSETRATVVLALLLAVPGVVLYGLAVVLEHQSIVIATQVVGAAFILYTALVILRQLFRPQRVTFDMICASLCVYLLLAVLWAIAYSLLYLLEGPESFFFSYAPEGDSELMHFGGDRTGTAIYYSLVTMTTLGYGDIVPRSPPARMLAAVEALAGQIYLAVLVARLVGLYVAQGTEDAAARRTQPREGE